MTNRLPAPSHPGNEAASLAAELATAYDEAIATYRDLLGLSLEEADARASRQDAGPDEIAADVAHLCTLLARDVDWGHLQRLVVHDPGAVAEVWEDLKAEARDELANGYRVAEALAWKGSPFERARYLAVRESFRTDMPPQTGIEAALLDLAAADFTDFLRWDQQLHTLASAQAELVEDDLVHEGKWGLPTVSATEAIEQAARMAEQAHKRFLRTIKMLVEQRRSTQMLYVGHAAQINVGQQQVNVAESARRRSEDQEDLPKSSGPDHLVHRGNMGRDD